MKNEDVHRLMHVDMGKVRWICTTSLNGRAEKIEILIENLIRMSLKCSDEEFCPCSGVGKNTIFSRSKEVGGTYLQRGNAYLRSGQVHNREVAWAFE